MASVPIQRPMGRGCAADAEEPDCLSSPTEWARPHLGKRLSRAAATHASGKHARGYAPELPRQALAEHHVDDCGLEGLAGVGTAPGSLRTKEAATQAPAETAETRAEGLGGLPGCGKRGRSRFK